mmetsp:Transcript_8375/g.10052  ORF Transcript_8375/g.10052 Transcript_8375/m.10052 type:complete len:93 (-) Transcript_8375:112-390(-)
MSDQYLLKHNFKLLAVYHNATPAKSRKSCPRHSFHSAKRSNPFDVSFIVTWHQNVHAFQAGISMLQDSGFGKNDRLDLKRLSKVLQLFQRHY